MLWLGEPLEAVVQADRLLSLICGQDGQVQGDVPERVDGRGHVLARLADNIALELAWGIHIKDYQEKKKRKLTSKTKLTCPDICDFRQRFRVWPT